MNQKQKTIISIVVPIIIILITLALSFPGTTFTKKIYPYHWKVIFTYLTVASIIILAFLWFMHREKGEEKSVEKQKRNLWKSIKSSFRKKEVVQEEPQIKIKSRYFIIAILIIGTAIILIIIQTGLERPALASALGSMVGSSIWVFLISEAIWIFILKRRKGVRLFCFSLIFFCAVLVKLVWL